MVLLEVIQGYAATCTYFQSACLVYSVAVNITVLYTLKTGVMYMPAVLGLGMIQSQE